jgi:hypothetical protein
MSRVYVSGRKFSLQHFTPLLLLPLTSTSPIPSVALCFSFNALSFHYYHPCVWFAPELSPFVVLIFRNVIQPVQGAGPSGTELSRRDWPPPPPHSSCRPCQWRAVSLPFRQFQRTILSFEIISVVVHISTFYNLRKRGQRIFFYRYRDADLRDLFFFLSSRYQLIQQSTEFSCGKPRFIKFQNWLTLLLTELHLQVCVLFYV